jgi:hypothetical protein
VRECERGRADASSDEWNVCAADEGTERRDKEGFTNNVVLGFWFLVFGQQAKPRPHPRPHLLLRICKP